MISKAGETFKHLPFVRKKGEYEYIITGALIFYFIFQNS